MSEPDEPDARVLREDRQPRLDEETRVLLLQVGGAGLGCERVQGEEEEKDHDRDREDQSLQLEGPRGLGQLVGDNAPALDLPDQKLVVQLLGDLQKPRELLGTAGGERVPRVNARLVRIAAGELALGLQKIGVHGPPIGGVAPSP